jgi:hypothetical protein
MSMDFDKFPDRKTAVRFGEKVKKEYGLRYEVAAEDKELYEGFAVHIERADDDSLKFVKDKIAIRVLAEKMSAEDNAIKDSAKKTHPWYEPIKTDYFKDHLACVIEQAVEDLAKSYGARCLGT